MLNYLKDKTSPISLQDIYSMQNFTLPIMLTLATLITGCASHRNSGSTDVNANWVQVTIIDNGRGFDVAQEPGSAGKGLSNLVRRAESIGAEIL